MRYNTSMASQYFTSEKAQANPQLKSLGLALQSAPYSDENISLALFFLSSLEGFGGREIRLQEFFGHFDKRLFPEKSVDFSELIKIIGFVKYLVHDKYHFEHEIFGFEPYGEDAEESIFGLAKETSSNNLTRHIHDAILLISLLLDAKRTNFREVSTDTPAKEEEAPPTVQPTPQDEVGAVVGSSLMGGGGSSKDKKKTEEEKKKEKEEEEKKKEKEKKKPLDETPASDLRNMAQADRKMRHEILRIQSAITYQLASIYGIPESQLAAFTQEIAQHVTPIVYTHLHKLSGEKLIQALSSNRTNLYLQSLSSLQRNPRFQQIVIAATQSAHKKATGKTLTQDDVVQKASSVTLGQATQGVEQQFQKVLENEVKEKIPEAGSPLTTNEVLMIAQQHDVGADKIEGLLKNFFEDQKKLGKIHISESEFNAFFIRLQSYGISKRYSSAVSNTDVEKFYDAFTQSFGIDSNKILLAFQQAAGFDGSSEKLLFANLLLNYSDKIALSAYHNSNIGGGEKNLAALYTTPQKLPPILQKENDKNLETHIFHYGRDAVAHAFYTPANQFHALLGTLQVGTKKHNDLKNAVSFHQIANVRGEQRMANMREKTIYYLLSSVFGFSEVDVQASIHFQDFAHISIFQESPSYLLSLAPDQLTQDYNAPFSQPPSAEIEAQKYADQEKGLLMAKALGFVFLGPESIEVIDKAWQIATTVRSVVQQLPGGEHLAKLLDFVVFDKFEQMGKFVDFMLKALALAALLFFGSLATAAGLLSTIIQAAHLSSVLQNGLVGLSRGIQSGAKSIFSGLQSGATEFGKGWNTFLQNLNSSLGAPISTTSVMYATGTIIGTSFILQTVLFSAFLTPRTGGASSGLLTSPGAILISGYEGCWPTNGSISGYITYQVNKEKHSVWGGGGGGPVGGFPEYGPVGSAIDIGSSATGFNPVYTPFAGTANFYPAGSGISGDAIFNIDGKSGVGPYGNHVVIKTPDYILIFAHLKNFAGIAREGVITTNMTVSAGQLIGVTNSSGNSNFNHLHYEVVGKYGKQIDILNLLPLSKDKKLAILQDEKKIFGTETFIGSCSIKE